MSERSELAADAANFNERPVNRTPRRRPGQQRSRSRQPQEADFWRAVPEPAKSTGIAPAADPTVLLRSLGPAPLPGQAGAADHYLAAVIERASRLAAALAAAAELLEDPDPD